jgi:predicted kinase
MSEVAPQLILIRGPIGVGKSTTVGLLRERIQPASVVDFDAFKRQIDTTQSSDWRRKTALKTAAFMTEHLMQAMRRIIVDIHSSSHEQFEEYKALADRYTYPTTSCLLFAPVDVCLQRTCDRFVPGLHYPIDEAMVRDYHNQTFTITNEPNYDTSVLAPETVVDLIYNQLHKI